MAKNQQVKQTGKEKKHLHGLCFQKKSDKELKNSQQEINREKFGDWEDLQ